MREPSEPGDLIGRDLAYPVVGLLGHVGVWDGTGVSEVLNEGTNVIKVANNLSDFKARAAASSSKMPYWGSLSPNIPRYFVPGCYFTTCRSHEIVRNGGDVQVFEAKMAVVKRAYQAYLIGADYTLTATRKDVFPSIGKGYPSYRGMYRCDTFVHYLYKSTYTPDPVFGITPWESRYTYTYTAPSYQYPSDKENKAWIDKIGALSYRPMLPTTLFNYFK